MKPRVGDERGATTGETQEKGLTQNSWRLFEYFDFPAFFPASKLACPATLPASLAASTADSFLPFFVGATFLRAFLPAARSASASSAAYDCTRIVARIVARESAARACFASLATLPFRTVGSQSFESSFLRYYTSAVSPPWCRREGSHIDARVPDRVHGRCMRRRPELLRGYDHLQARVRTVGRH
jgi:hypothetical protein